MLNKFKKLNKFKDFAGSRKEKGFTLIELIVVILILSILSAVALPKFINLQRDARIAKLNAVQGSVLATAALVHAAVLARSGTADPVTCAGGGGIATNSGGAAGTICTESGVIALVNGYPDVTAVGTAGLLSGIGLTTAFNPTLVQVNAAGYNYTSTATVATFQIQGATTPASCQFTYTEAVANAAPTISSIVSTGC